MPKKIHRNKKLNFPFPYKEIFLKSEDNASIHAVHFSSKSPKSCILYLHGNSGNINRWGKYAENFIKLNYDVVLPDYRNFGKSRGKFSELAFHQDAQLYYDYIKKLWPEKNIIIYGRSLGSGIATKLASENAPQKLILETPYINFQEIHKRYFPFFPKVLLRYHFRTDIYIKKVNCPIYLIHGTKDRLVPFTASEKLNEIIQFKAKLIKIEGGSHKNLYKFEEYKLFLEEL